MLTLPLPVLTFALASIACGLIWRLDLANRLARALFTAAFAAIALGTLLVALRFGYGQQALIPLQRAVPLFICPLIYLGFAALTRPAPEMRGIIATHLGIATLAALLPQALPQMRAGFDLVIAASYLFYALALLRLWARGADRLSHVALDLAGVMRKSMLAAAGMQMLTLLFDAGIAVSFALGHSDHAIRLISLGSVLSMGVMLAAIVTFAGRGRRKSVPNQPAAPPDDRHGELEQAARQLLTDSQLYLDSDLTLERFAKRLHVPARALSEAINQTQGQNVSQYVNGFRLRHAAALLESGNDSVIKVMEQSGFLTRSNFYREFERVFRQSPADYRKAQRDSG